MLSLKNTEQILQKLLKSKNLDDEEKEQLQIALKDIQSKKKISTMKTTAIIAKAMIEYFTT